MKPAGKSWKDWLVLAVKVAIIGLVIWFVRGALAGAWKELRHGDFTLQPWWLAAAAGFYSSALVCAGFYWRHVLHALGHDVAYGETLRAYFIGHLGKYVPGKAMVILLRATLIRRTQVSLGVGAASVFVETLTLLGVGAFWGVLVLLLRARDQQFLVWGGVVLAAAALLPTWPPVFRRVVRWVGVGRKDPEIAAKLGGLRYRTILLGWIVMSVVWLLIGISLWATLRGMGVSDAPLADRLPEYVGAVSLSFVAGFVTMIPGGLGVREALLVGVLPRFFGITAAQAIVAATLLRLVWLLAEILLSAILYAIGIGCGWSAMNRMPASVPTIAPPQPTENER